MPRTGLWLRVFVGLLAAILPPILLLVGVLLVAESVLLAADPNLIAILVVVGVMLWAAMVAVVYTRVLSEEVRSLVSLAQRGESEDQLEIGSAYQQIASSLEERNRQVASLARESGLVPIDDRPARVAASVVATVRTVLGDPTWRLAILTSDNPELLPAGVYRASGEEPRYEEIRELERWASVTGTGTPARLAEGPWGAFTIIDMASSDRLRAILYAPWEGRTALSPAEFDLLRLVGQHAGTALEHSLLYAQVRAQADELNRLAAIQGDFLRGVTHDLQTPLTSIGALATELRANADVPEAARADLDSIGHQAERLRRMVGQLLVASRLEAGVLTARQEVFAARPVVERTWKALRADRPFEIIVEGAPHLAVGDPDRLEQVMWAVLDNAAKYSPPGSPVEVRIGPEDGSLLIRVRDRGTGMDEVTCRRAFEQFYRSARARELAPDGSGVGLYAARGLMEAMGGSITLDSTLGGGTTATVRLPAEPSESSD